MDYKRIREIKAKSEGLVSRMYLLEEMQKETMEKINETQKVCNHEFIFINKKYENKAYEYLQYGKCLICGKGITLTPNNFELNDKMCIPSEKIVDVAEKIDDFAIDCDCSESKSEVEEAQRVFDQLITTFGDTLFIKKSIINSINELRKVETLKKK